MNFSLTFLRKNGEQLENQCFSHHAYNLKIFWGPQFLSGKCILKLCFLYFKHIIISLFEELFFVELFYVNIHI